MLAGRGEGRRRGRRGKRAEVGGGGRGKSSRTLCCFLCRGWARFCGGGSCLLMSHLHGYGLWLVPWNVYINEDGEGVEGTLAPYPHGNESECSSRSLRLLVCIRAAVCNFWRAYGDSASYLLTYVMNMTALTFTRTQRFCFIAIN